MRPKFVLGTPRFMCFCLGFGTESSKYPVPLHKNPTKKKDVFCQVRYQRPQTLGQLCLCPFLDLKFLDQTLRPGKK